jgi:hypothetical protein
MSGSGGGGPLRNEEAPTNEVQSMTGPMALWMRASVALVAAAAAAMKGDRRDRVRKGT